MKFTLRDFYEIGAHQPKVATFPFRGFMKIGKHIDWSKTGAYVAESGRMYGFTGDNHDLHGYRKFSLGTKPTKNMCSSLSVEGKHRGPAVKNVLDNYDQERFMTSDLTGDEYDLASTEDRSMGYRIETNDTVYTWNDMSGDEEKEKFDGEGISFGLQMRCLMVKGHEGTSTSPVAS